MTAPVQSAFAAPSIVINDQPVVFSDSPVVIDGRVLVPFRALFEALGAAVSWDEANHIITAVKGSDEIKLVVGGLAYRNGRAIPLSPPAAIIQDRAMVPLRFITEALDYQVKWDEANQTAAVFQSFTGTPIPPVNSDCSDDQKVQYYLSGMGFATRPEDAEQNKVLTASSAILFQVKMGLKVTGSFDAATLSALEKYAWQGWTFEDIMKQPGTCLAPLSKDPEMNGKLDESEMVVIPTAGSFPGRLPNYTAFGWAALVQAAGKDPRNNMIRFCLSGSISGYRSYKDQVNLYNVVGAEIAAKPGSSRHGYGLAIDFAFTDPKEGRAKSNELKWMEKYADEYGFTPNNNPSDKAWEPYFPDGGINFYESWHWNYMKSAKTSGKSK